MRVVYLDKVVYDCERKRSTIGDIVVLPLSAIYLLISIPSAVPAPGQMTLNPTVLKILVKDPTFTSSN